ncbi:MAG: AbrB/MazE/SpoVT family DNA-binding domain-containing protein [Candidatus Eremiobacteraeota bacterium]|nr:AbrB/MazE/SpoVT family DNA-binding domain-containing protein [Candidatus Eremiobacteraeota bacterium]MBV8284754.1 AbrB/MazE/SpoVT family DNA-binding domain-containing protein [Candidatus Eremiobacteraeota bacterium]MBV8433551.1 AbrB/MazE/SpoVT family DNA-binding domain-containing protein [Candidatus Eremiobacteraeota bacterium]
MRTHLHRLGNSQAVVIPKPLLAHLGIERAVELELVEDHIEVRKPRERACFAIKFGPSIANV